MVEENNLDAKLDRARQKVEASPGVVAKAFLRRAKKVKGSKAVRDLLETARAIESGRQGFTGDQPLRKTLGMRKKKVVLVRKKPKCTCPKRKIKIKITRRRVVKKAPKKKTRRSPQRRSQGMFDMGLFAGGGF